MLWQKFVILSCLKSAHFSESGDKLGDNKRHLAEMIVFKHNAGRWRHQTIPMLNWANCDAVEKVPGKVSGAWLFKDTRIPVEALFENLEGGATVEEFLDWFPGVTRKQVETVLEYAVEA